MVISKRIFSHFLVFSLLSAICIAGNGSGDEDVSEVKQFLQTFKHDDIVESVVFSPDGTQVLTASDDKTAVLWDLEDNKCATLVLTRLTNTVVLWDAMSGNILMEFPYNETVLSATFSHDGTRILIALSNGVGITYDLEGNEFQ